VKGTGKSVLLREIIRMQGGSPSDRLGITASTGIAAINIGGTTLHSWFVNAMNVNFRLTLFFKGGNRAGEGACKEIGRQGDVL
jgi:hypothetical protein